AGNGVLLRNMATGSLESLDHAEAVYKGLTWTEKGDGFATVRGVDDKGFEDKLYSVVAFKGLGTGAAPAKFLYDPKTDQSFPVGMTISAVRNAAWRDDLTAVTFGIREDKADLVLWHWKDPRLQSQQAVQETQDKNFSYLAVWRPGDGKFLRLADD